MMENFEELDRQVTAALERKPAVRVPEEFAARVAARAATLPVPKASYSTRYGQSASAVGAALLLVAMFCLAPWTKPSFASLGFDVQLLLLTQLLGIGAWFLVRREV